MQLQRISKLSNSIKVVAICTILFIITFLSYFHNNLYFVVAQCLAQMFLIFILTAIHKHLAIIYLILLGIITTLYFPLLRIYGDIDYNLLLSISQTDVQESKGYLEIVPVKIILYLIGFWILLAIGIVIIKYFNIGSSKRLKLSISILGLLLLQGIYWNVGKENNVFNKPLIENGLIAYNTLIPPIRIGYVIYSKSIEVQSLLGKSNQINQYKKYRWNISETEKIKPINIIVLGESESKNIRNIFDLKYPDNFVNRTNKIEFLNYYATSSITINSLSKTLIYSNLDSSIYQLSMQSLLNTLGIKTFWISNQGQIGKDDSPISALAMGFDSTIFLKRNGYVSETINDKELIKYFNLVVDLHTTDNICVVLHLMGSHPPFFFTSSTDVTDKYLETVTNTTNILEHIYNKLINTNRPFNLIYFSDHGLKYHEHNYVHGNSDISNYHVPLYIWRNDLDSNIQIEAKRSAFDFIPIFSELNQIVIQEESIRHPSFKRISNSPQLDSIQVLDHNNNTLNLKDLIYNEYPK